MKRIILLTTIALLVPCWLRADDQVVPSAGKFKSCENKAGEGFFWVDTTTGKTWWANPQDPRWEYCGQPEGAGTAPVGTYVPYENKSGPGMFILNAATGEGWWTDGKKWKRLGVPTDKPGKP
jgi:hypothetical protein